MVRRIFCISITLFSVLSALSSTSDSDFDPGTLVLKEVFARRTDTPPKIDGDLSDAVWDKALVISEFFQTEPKDLAQPTEKTEVKLLYDNDNIYVAFMNYDSDSKAIVSRFSRRDSWAHSEGMRGGSASGINNSDWIGVAVDSRNDNLTGYSFIVNAAGSKLDSYVYDDSRYDMSWDGVWDAKVNRNEQGWSVEFRLPFSLFNFSNIEEQTWGFMIRRFIFRKQERMEWPGKKRGVKGNVSRFGVLKGLSEIPPPKQIELTPYTLGGYHANGGGDQFTGSAGVDMEYGVGSNTTGFMTVNPDFGQVEADPSVLNLSAFETFYDEKRPFFVEGMSIFQNPHQSFEGNLFHTRRIGARPSYFAPESGAIVDRPDATNIVSAVKLLGKSSSGLEFAVVDAMTNREYATVESDSGGLNEFLIEPYTNHFAGRIKKSVINDLSTIGVMVTDQRRQLGHSATVGSADWRMKFADNKFTFSGQLVSSSTDGKNGNAGRVHFAYDDPVWWNASATFQAYDDDFDINDMGYLKRAGIQTWDVNFRIRQQDPWGPILKSNLGISYDLNHRNDGVMIKQQMNFSGSVTTTNYWNFGIHHGQILPSYSDEDLFRDSRAWIKENPIGYRGGAWLSTDSRKWISFRPGLGYGWKDNGYGGYRVALSTTIRASQRLSTSINIAQHLRLTPQQWVGIVSDDLGEHRIYGKAKQLTDEVTLRLSYAFSPDLSFQTYLQPFRAKVDYSDFVELAAPMTRQYIPFNYSDNKNFIMDNTIGTFVMRWEYLPGSVIYVVYNLNAQDYFSASSDSWSPSKSNTLFIKLNYWFQA